MAVTIFRVCVTDSVIVRNPRSGRPSRLALTAAPDTSIAEKPARSTSRAVSASYTPGATTAPSWDRSSRRTAGFELLASTMSSLQR